jgi:asparagine synthase (glutamine-hydrolysing)
MSGIVGMVNLDGSPADRVLLGRLTDYLAFRGPDAQAIWSQGPVGLGHTLLRTVDDTRPDSQPLSLDGQVWIVADARVDGRGELRQKLRSRGFHDLEEATDAELILQSYLAWGEGCVQHLIGDFAFAIWDEPQRRLFVARDHFGVKPFYYARVANCLVFSNTLNCIRMHPEVSDELNDQAIADFLLFECNQDFATTTFADINQVPPAHCLIWQNGALQVRRYWSLPLPDLLRYVRQQDYVDHFQELLTQAVKDRLRSSQVGICMSGGLDSSILAALCKEVMNRRPALSEPIAFTEVYDWLIPHEERHYSGLVAAHLNIRIHFHGADDYQLYERWEQNELGRPEPNHYPLMAAWVDLMNMIVGQSRVVLTGNGGDSILCPSGSYLYDLLKSLQVGRLTKELAQCLRYRRRPYLGIRKLWQNWFSKANRPQFPPWLAKDLSDRLNLRARWNQANNHHTPSFRKRIRAYRDLSNPFWPDFFQKIYDPGVTGKMLEFRHPYFDLRVVNYAMAMPELPWCSDKLLFREVGRGLLPEVVRTRPKSPLAGEPIREVTRQPDSKWVNGFIPMPELGRYVDATKILSLQNEIDYCKIRQNLLPLTLHYWLNHLRKSSLISNKVKQEAVHEFSER